MKIGILGYGSIGKRHHVNITAICGVPPAIHDPNDPNTSDRNDVLNWADAIVVATPSQRHAEDLMDVIKANKHVLVEKPFGYDCPPFLDGYIGMARKGQPHLIIATGFNCRYHPCVVEAKEAILDGKLGNIQAASFSVNQLSTKEPYLRDGVIRNWLSHEIDIAHYLLGESPVFGYGEVVSCTADDQREANIIMKFDSVADKVYIHGDYITTPHQRFFWIEGDKSSIHANLETGDFFLNREGINLWTPDMWDKTYIDEMKDFIASIEIGAHQLPLATGEDGIRAMYSVMNARYKAGLELMPYTKPEGSCV